MYSSSCLKTTLTCLISVALMTACATPAALNQNILNNSTHVSNQIKVSDYNDKGVVFAFFHLKNGTPSVYKIKDSVSAADIKAINHYNNSGNKASLEDCIAIYNNAYKPCYEVVYPPATYSPNGIAHGELKEALQHSVFNKTNMALTIPTLVVFSPFILVDGVFSALSLENPANAVKEVSKMASDFKTDQKTVIAVGNYISNQIVDDQRKLSSYLQTNSGIPPQLNQATLVLSKDFVASHINKNNSLEKNTNNYRVLKQYSSDIQAYNQIVIDQLVHRDEDLPNWIKLMNSNTQNVTTYYPYIMGKSFFAKDVNISNFSNSIAYQTILKNLKPTVAVIKSNQAGITLNYPNKSFSFAESAVCKSSGKTTEYKDVSLLAAVFHNAEGKQNTYEQFSCSINSHKYKEFERLIVGNISQTAQLDQSWAWSNFVSSKYITAQPDPTLMNPYTDYKIVSSDSSSVKLRCLPDRSYVNEPIIWRNSSGQYYSNILGGSHPFDRAAKQACDID